MAAGLVAGAIGSVAGVVAGEGGGSAPPPPPYVQVHAIGSLPAGSRADLVMEYSWDATSSATVTLACGVPVVASNAGDRQAVVAVRPADASWISADALTGETKAMPHSTRCETGHHADHLPDTPEPEVVIPTQGYFVAPQPSPSPSPS